MSLTFKDKVDLRINQRKNIHGAQSIPAPTQDAFKKQPSKGKELEWWNPLSWFASVGDVYDNLQRGAVKSIEGMTDFVISQAGGAIADLFNSDSLEKEVAKITKYDVTGALMDKKTIGNGSISDFTNRGILGAVIGKDFVEEKTLLKDGGTVEQVAQGIGGILPPILVGYFTGGSSLAQYASFGASAGGQATQEALNEGANLKQSRMYGAGSALLETGVEAISGGIGGVGVGALQKVAPKLTKNVVAKYIGNMAGEGIEEMISEFANPYLKRATYDENAKNASYDEILRSGAIGALTGGIMQGGTLVNLAKYGVKGEKAMSLYNEAQQINTEMYELEKKGKLTPQLRKKYLKKRNDLLAEVGNTMSEIKSENKLARVGNAVTPTMTQTATFDARKTLVQETVDSYNKRTGNSLKVEFTKDPEHNGSFNPNTNTITIDENAENPYSIVLGHEVAHSTESNSKYNDLYNEVIKTIGETNLAQMRENLKTIKDYENMDIENLNKEVVADYVGKNFFTDFQKAQKLISNNQTLGSKIISFVKDKIARISKNSTEYKELKNIETRLQEIMDNKEVNLANNGEIALQYSSKDAFIHNGYYFKSHKKIPQKIRENVLNEIIAEYEKSESDYISSSKVKDGYLIVYDVQDSIADITSVINLELFRNQKSLTHSEYMKLVSILNKGIIRGANANADIIRIIESISGKKLSTKQDTSIHTETIRNNAVGRHDKVSEGKSETDRGANTGLDEKSNVKYSSKKNPATQEQIDELNSKEINEKLKNQVKTQLIEEDMSWIDNIKGLTERGKQAIVDSFHNRDAIKSKLQILLTNSFAGVENELKAKIEQEGAEKGWTKSQIKEEVAKQTTEVKMAYNKAYRSISGAEYKIGTDLKKLWSKINKKGFNYTNDFELFLLHRLNIKRMSLAEKYKALDSMYKSGQINQDMYDKINEELSHIKDKPVFGEDITSEYSRKEVARLEKEHPEFVGLANEVYDYLASLMDIRKTAGIVNQKQIDFMFDAYGDEASGKSWYVPTYRENEHGANTSALSGNIGVTKGIHKAKGSDKDIQSIMLSMSEQTIGVHKQSAINQLFKMVHDKLPEHFEKQGTQKQTRKDMDGEIETEKEKKNTTVYFYENGDRVEYKCSSFIGVAFESIRNQKSKFEEVLDNTTGKMVSLMKKLTTEWNLFFAVRNLFRDASDAFIYTKYSPNLIKRYAETYQEIRKGDKSGYYELYMINGGQNFSFFDKKAGIKDKKQFFLIEKISQINEVIELMPRLSEFIESLKAQGYEVTADNINTIPQEAIDKAMFEASEITVNFARGGTFTKKMNKYLMPYLNASIQGWCKTWNTFVHPTSMRAWGMSMAKIVAMALPTLLFNEIFFDDDEEYQQLADDIKGSYFLIKTGNNKFIRIPRGRVEAVVGDALQRLYRTSKGEKDAFDGYASNTLKNVSPVDNLTRSILSPFTDITTNTTWYGGNIENASMQKLPINERYDNNTSEIAKILNKVVPSISPKKWHYLLDQYSGVLGDVFLPITSKNKDLSGLSGLTVNSLENNKYTNKFYDVQTKLEQTKNSQNGTAVDKAKMRYFNKMNTKVSELYKESKTTTDKETRLATQKLIVQLQKQTLENLDKFSVTLEKYSYGLSIEELYEDYYREATRECFGAETALMDYDKRVYEKAINFNKAGLDWNTFYNVYFDAQDITSDYDENGDAISGSRKQKVTQYVKNLKLTATQKYMLMGLLGYKNANGESQVKSQLIRSGFKGDSLTEMLELCGY